jgi:hypothetical protein
MPPTAPVRLIRNAFELEDLVAGHAGDRFRPGPRL